MNAVLKNSELTDLDVIEMICNGDHNKYEILMRRYNQRLYRLGRSFFQDENEIEDIMQFTYIRAFEKLRTFENRAAFSTWLSRIFINEALARKKYRQRFYTNNEDENLFEEQIMKTPEERTENNELKEILEKAIGLLPEKYRAVFIMHEIENLDVKETAESLELTESNVKVRLMRARKMLQKTINSYYKASELYTFKGHSCDSMVQKVFSKLAIK